MDKIRALVADDSAFMRKLIQEILLASNQIEIIGTARNGKDVIEKIRSLKPDVVTMDIEMPVMNGIEALKIIMKDTPVPIVMLSSTTQSGAENTLLAMQYGAVDFIAKPSGPISLDLQKIERTIIEKVVAASKANIKGLSLTAVDEKLSSPHLLNRSKIELGQISRPMNDRFEWEGAAKKIVCIGTSTGGPRALQNVLIKLPENIDAPIVVVQHMPPGFTKSLANRLNSLSKITVKEAEHGEVLRKGTAYIAPGGYHLLIKKSVGGPIVHLEQSEPRNGHRPSVDVMFESLCQLTDYAKIAVIMTGMGSDGSEGLIQLNKTGRMKAIAESQETSIVFGMPKAAISTSLVSEVENVENIASTIMKFV